LLQNENFLTIVSLWSFLAPYENPTPAGWSTHLQTQHIKKDIKPDNIDFPLNTYMMLALVFQEKGLLTVDCPSADTEQGPFSLNKAS
jgi:hypothetical protein